MGLSEERVRELSALCLSFRRELIRILHTIQTGHPGGSLSATEIITTLYQEKMSVPSAGDPDRDRFVLSKGHAAPMLYLNLAEKGFFPKEDLATLRQAGSFLQGHPCAHKTPGVDVSSGPLGLGLSVGLGMALSGKLQKKDYTVYVLLGDGELQEGGCWEAAMAAAKYDPGNLIAIVDHNGVQLDGTNDEIMPLFDLAAKFRSFHWEVLTCNGHDIAAFSDAVDRAKTIKEKPVVIICETVKGKGISFMEGKNTWHGKPISDEDYQLAMEQLGGTADE
ncbi:MAG: transketolase [Firmicutes bacterium]|nr:transketolase [Bacillota bacterium]